MSKLLRAGVHRYTKSIVFWLAIVVTVVVAILCGNQAKTVCLDEFYILIEFIAFAVMISLIVGREYDEGTFRNKVISGHTKGSIFLSELIVGIGACSLMFLIFTCIFAAFNCYVFSVISFGVIVRIFIDSLLVNACFATLFVTIGCLVPHKAVVAIVNILLVFCIIFVTYSAENVVEQEEFFTEYKYEVIEVTDEFGKNTAEVPIEGSDYQVKNPWYIDGPTREICEVLYDVIPYGHLREYILLSNSWFGGSIPESNKDAALEEPPKNFEISKEENKSLNLNLIYSVVVLAAVSGIGFAAFRKIELK